MRNSLYYLFGFLTALLLFFGLTRLGFVPLFESPVTVSVIDETASPDGAFTATTNRASNANGWCEERTNIHKSGEAFDWEREYIFNIDCGSRVEIRWEGDRKLVINYSYNDAGKVRTSRQFRSKDKEVSISYFLRQ